MSCLQSEDTAGLSLSGQRFPAGWAEETKPLRLAQHQAPVIVQPTSSATTSTKIKQYPMALETKEKLHISWLEETGVLVPCQSLWNTSLLLVKKPGNSDSYESDSSASP